MLAGVLPRAPLDTDVAIETPEHIVFRHRLAGPGRRLLAYVIDLVICYGAFMAIAFVVLASALGTEKATSTVESTPGVGVGILLLLLFGIQWVYFAVLEARYGATPGKRALRCRVVMMDGRPADFSAAALRNVMRVADALPLTYTAGLVSLAGLVAMSVTKHFQRLGDLVAGTMVIVTHRPRAATPIVLSPPAAPHELALLPDEVGLDADERQAIEMFLRRRAGLGFAREAELARMIAPAVAARFGLAAIDPSRGLALLYDRAANAGRVDAPPSSRSPGPWR